MCTKSSFIVMCLTAVAMGSSLLAQTHANDEGSALVNAQTASTVQSTNPTCFTAAERNKAPLDDFWTNYRGSSKYEDSVFTPDDSSLYWTEVTHSDGSTANEKASLTASHWQRAGDVFADHSLYGTNGVTPEDVRQGAIGDCWFLSALSALSEVPGRIERIFHNPGNELSPNGIYALKFYTLGVPHTVIVDDYLPMTKSGDDYRTIFSHMGIDSAVWAPIMEKAFAKYHGNYGHIEGGDSATAALTLSGAPHTAYKHSSLSEEELWAHLHDADGNNKIIQVGTNGNNNDQTDHQGLVNGHAYTVLGCVELDSGEKLVKMRNPWASESYKGAWCDDCNEWDETSKKTAGWVNADDGMFFMPLNNFKSTFDETSVTEDVGDWHQDHFLVFNDQYHDDNPGTLEQLCGSKCTAHTLLISSDVTQDVFVTAHTWDKRCQAKTQHCSDLYGNMNDHFIKAPSDIYHRQFKDGSIQVPKFELEAGTEVEIVLEFDWSNSEIPNDWSVTIWGQDGVHIRHKKGYLTDTNDMPLTGDEPSSNDVTDDSNNNDVTDDSKDKDVTDDSKDKDVTDDTKDNDVTDDSKDKDVTDDSNNNDVTDDTKDNDVTDDTKDNDRNRTVTDDTNNNDVTDDNTNDTTNDCVHFKRDPVDPEGFEYGDACPLQSGDTDCGQWYRYNGGEPFWTTCANKSAEIDEYIKNLTADDTIVNPVLDNTIVDPVLDANYQDFLNWVNAYEPQEELADCLYGYSEEFDRNVGQYQTVMKNDCDKWEVKITIEMSTGDWNRFEYKTFTDEGQVENKTVMDCEDEDEEEETTKCTFLVGSTPIGWRNAVGDDGILSYSDAYKYKR